MGERGHTGLVDLEPRKEYEIEELADYLGAWYLGTLRSTLEFVA